MGHVQGFQPPTTRTDMPDASPEMMAAQKYVSSEYETPESIRRLRERMEVRARDIEKGSGISPWDWFKAAGAARKEKDAFGALGAGLEQLGIAGADRESAGRREMMDLLKEDVYLSGIEERGRGTHEQVEQKKQSGAVDAAVRKYGLELKEWGLDEAFSRDILKSQLSLAERLIDNSMKDKAAARKFNNERRLVVLEMIKDESIVMSREVIGVPKLDWVVKMNSLGGRTTVPGSAVWDEELARRLGPFYAAADVPQPGFTSPIPRSITTPSP